MSFDDDGACQRLWGWWIAPDGTVSEGEEHGFHGEMAWRLLQAMAEVRGSDYAGTDLDVCIEDAKKLGFVRISTFHGSDAIHLDYEGRSVTAAALRACADLVRAYRRSFSRYVFEFEGGLPKEFAGGHHAVRRHLLDAAKDARSAPDEAATAEVLGMVQPQPTP